MHSIQEPIQDSMLGFMHSMLGRAVALSLASERVRHINVAGVKGGEEGPLIYSRT